MRKSSIKITIEESTDLKGEVMYVMSTEMEGFAADIYAGLLKQKDELLDGMCDVAHFRKMNLVDVTVKDLLAFKKEDYVGLQNNDRKE